jgi:hypothetical protein
MAEGLADKSRRGLAMTCEKTFYDTIKINGPTWLPFVSNLCVPPFMDSLILIFLKGHA